MTFIVLVYLLFLVVAAALCAVFMWQAGAFWKLPSATYPAALKACLVIGIGAYAVAWLRTICDSAAPGAPLYTDTAVAIGPSYVGIATQVLLTFLIAWFVTKLFFFANVGDAAVVALAFLLPAWLVVFLLGLGMRATLLDTVVQAPSGMAPLLQGSHENASCENCGNAYCVGAPNPQSLPDKKLASAYSAMCPNCGQFNLLAEGSKVLPGDCLVISKLGKPSRFDLVQVRPEDGAPPDIRRVIGLPGETLEFAGGDVFVDGKRLQKGPGVAEDLWVLVHDSNFRPAKLAPEGWGWKAPGSRSKWKFDGEWECDNNRASPETLSFGGRITDRVTYDMRQDGKPNDVFRRYVPVGDIKLDLEIDSLVGDGAFGVEYVFGDFSLTLTVNGQGAVGLTASDLGADGSQVGLGSASGKLTSALTLNGQITLAIRDGQAYVTERGSPVASLKLGPQDIDSVRARLQSPANDTFRLDLTARGIVVKFTRMRVYRDIYYRGPEEMPAALFEGVAKRPPAKVKLGQEAYFVLGDNPCRARDSRVYGPVAPTAMLGVVRTLAWPLSRYRSF